MSYMDDLLHTDEIDPQLAAAGLVLEKMAEDEGVDLESFSDADITSMLSEIMEGGDGDENEGGDSEGGEGEGGDAAAANGGGGGGGGDGGGEQKAASLTHGMVLAELQKVAATEGVDLSSLSPQEMQAAWDNTVEAMSDPTYQQQKLAAEEKAAEADVLGRIMAHGFNDELSKLAGKGAAVAKGLEGLGKKVVRAVGRTGGAEGRMNPRTARRIGAAVAGTGAAAAGAGAAGVAKKMKEKKAFDEAVEKRAAEILVANGIDPSTGEALDKVAEDAVQNAAMKLLESHGFTFTD